MKRTNIDNGGTCAKRQKTEANDGSPANAFERKQPEDFLLETDPYLRDKEIYEWILRDWYSETGWPEVPDTIFGDILEFVPHRQHDAKDLYDMTAAEHGLVTFEESGEHKEKIILAYEILMELTSTKEGFHELVHKCFTSTTIKNQLRKSLKDTDCPLMIAIRDKMLPRHPKLLARVQERRYPDIYNVYQCSAFMLSINFYRDFYFSGKYPCVKVPKYRDYLIDDFTDHREGEFLNPQVERMENVPNIQNGYIATPSFRYYSFMSRNSARYASIDTGDSKWWEEGFAMYWPRYHPSGNRAYFRELHGFEYRLHEEDDRFKSISVARFANLAVDGPCSPHDIGNGAVLLAISGTEMRQGQPHDLSTRMLALVLDIGRHPVRPTLWVYHYIQDKKKLLLYLKSKIESSSWWNLICNMKFQDVGLDCPQIDPNWDGSNTYEMY